ncbi:polyphosphate kinase 2 family protein [Litorivivens sp.]|uniref:polyphosphate kinase 2 family protein n=1 Tax=Litorivivens sp. TaxID=2020868 RepID=UPI0035693FA0
MLKLGHSSWALQSGSDRSLEKYASGFPDDFSPLKLPDVQGALVAAQRRFWASRKAALLIIFQGLDTSGKDGCIRAVCAGMDPMGFQAVGFGVPSSLERAHDFLWRVQPHLPSVGKVTLMNRSYYEAVLAERCLTDDKPEPDSHWMARYDSIRQFEKHLALNGTATLKFWLHIGRKKQRERLKQRLTDPERHWKFDPSDIHSWHERARHLGYADEALRQTHTDDAPWHIVPADDKGLCRRVVCLRVLEALQKLAGPYPSGDQAIRQQYLNELENK